MWKQRHDRWKGHYYDNFLMNLQNKIQFEIENNDYLNRTIFRDCLIYPRINSCLINKYNNENDTISAHKDSPTSFGLTPIVVILSVGDTRTLKLKKVKYDKKNPLSCKLDLNNQEMNKDFELEENSIFIMGGNSQIDFTHQIDKENKKKETRYSLTFRKFLVN